MVACNINKNSVKYQALKNMSGIPEFVLDSTISRFQNEFNRDPELDELPRVNSEPYFKKALNVKEFSNLNSIDTNDVLRYTASDTVEEANIKLNKQYKDLELTLTPFNSFTSVEIKHRPSEYGEIKPQIELEESYSPEKSRIIINEGLNKMSKLYGINIIPVTTEEIQDIPNAGVVKGFVHNGNIYINTDNATIDTSIHEMMHIFLGGVRYSDPNTYFKLVDSVEQLDRYQELSLQFPNKTRGDLNEEIFVQEFSKHIKNQPSLFDNMDISILSKLTYEVLRNIDTMISGEHSVKTLSGNIFNNSILDLSIKLQSSNINNTQEGTLTPDVIHRTLANYKEDLKKNNILEERCDG